MERVEKDIEDLRNQVRLVSSEIHSRLDKLIDDLPDKIRKSKNGSGALFVIQGLIITLLLTIIGGDAARLHNHTNLGAHPEALANISKLDAHVIEIREKMFNVDHKLENFKKEREKITHNLVSIEKFSGVLPDMKSKLERFDVWREKYGHRLESSDARQVEEINYLKTFTKDLYGLSRKNEQQTSELREKYEALHRDIGFIKYHNENLFKRNPQP